MINKQDIDKLKKIYDNKTYPKGDLFYGVSPVRKIQGFFYNFPFNIDKKFENFQKYIDKYQFNKKIELISCKNVTNINYEYCYSFMMEIRYNSVQYSIVYSESILLPYGFISTRKNEDSLINLINGGIKSLIGLNELNNFMLYIKAFNKSLIFLDKNEINIPISKNIEGRSPFDNILHAILFGNIYYDI
jgi:hypothetical protein